MVNGRHMASAAEHMVTVHHFRVWDHMGAAFVVPPLKSTLARILTVKGEIIPGTAEDVSETALDAEGRYDPQHPTGGR
jgi:hypothetical protein